MSVHHIPSPLPFPVSPMLPFYVSVSAMDPCRTCGPLPQMREGRGDDEQTQGELSCSYCCAFPVGGAGRPDRVIQCFPGRTGPAALGLFRQRCSRISSRPAVPVSSCEPGSAVPVSRRRFILHPQPAAATL